jgi:predicted RNA methylase
MFGIDLYPTPREVIERMLEFSSVTGKTILEPSAGTGNIVSYCKEMGAKNVIACEIDNRLAKLLSDKCNVIEDDFLNLTAERISHIDMIIMNPPFSSDEAHILHAWDIAPAGCEIIALCNYSILERSSWRSKKTIQELIKLNGTSQSFGDCFSNAERKTGVTIGCIRLHKPGTGESEFNGYFDLFDYEKEQVNQSGIVRYDFVQDIVSRYVEAVSMFDEVEQANIRIKRYILLYGLAN